MTESGGKMVLKLNKPRKFTTNKKFQLDRVVPWWSVFPGLLTSMNTTFFPKPPTTFLTCFRRGERQKYVGKKVCLNRASSSKTPGHESDTLTTEWGTFYD